MGIFAFLAILVLGVFVVVAIYGDQWLNIIIIAGILAPLHETALYFMSSEAGFQTSWGATLVRTALLDLFWLSIFLLCRKHLWPQIRPMVRMRSSPQDEAGKIEHSENRPEYINSMHKEVVPYQKPNIAETRPQAPNVKSLVNIATESWIHSAYAFGWIATSVYLSFFEGYVYTWWNWIFKIPFSIFTGSIWPLYWALLRWLPNIVD